MIHAKQDAFELLGPLLAELRKLDIIEKSTGRFYIKRGAFLHFHHDPEGIFADVKCTDGWHRLPANTKREFKKIVSLAKAQL
jgi:hypothetical protein